MNDEDWAYIGRVLLGSLIGFIIGMIILAVIL